MTKYILIALLLAGCGGYDPQAEEQGTQGAKVTATVPFAHESVDDIIARNDGPGQMAEDREIPNRDYDR